MNPPNVTDADLAVQERKWMVCGGKTKFEFADADRRAAYLRFAVYQCPYCDFWHLSSRKVRTREI